jgi:hypothetical protein
MLLTPVSNGKIFSQKSVVYFVGTPLGRRVNIKIIFFFKFTLRFKQSDTVPIISPPVSLTLVANLPAVSLIPVAIYQQYQQDQGYRWQNLRRCVLIQVVSLILMMLLDLRISPLIFERILNDPNAIFRDMWEDDL